MFIPLPIPNKEVKPCHADSAAQQAGEYVVAVLIKNFLRLMLNGILCRRLSVASQINLGIFIRKYSWIIYYYLIFMHIFASVLE
jgi:hypothetical protein